MGFEEEIEKLRQKLTPKPDFSNAKAQWAQRVRELILEIAKGGQRKEKTVTRVGNKIGTYGKLFHSRSEWFEKDGIKVFPGMVQMINEGKAGFKTLRNFAMSLPEDHELRKELGEIEEKEKKALEQWKKDNAEVLEKIRELMEEW